jgi:endonuclease III
MPVVDLRTGTRAGLPVRASAGVIAFKTMALYNALFVPVPIKDDNGVIIRYESIRKHNPEKKTWSESDEILQATGEITESSELDHHGNSIRRAFNFLLKSFQGTTEGEEAGGHWRVKGPARYPIDTFLKNLTVRKYYLTHASPVIRLAALAALGPAWWDQTEPKIWETIENAKGNAFLMGVAFEAMAVAGAGMPSAQWDRILATTLDVHHRLVWKEKTLAHGLDGAFIQNGAKAALQALKQTAAEQRKTPKLPRKKKKEIRNRERKSTMRLATSVPPPDFEFKKLPGIGPYTAGAITAFVYNKPVVLIETNIRRVFLYHFFKREQNIHDKEILELVQQTLPGKNIRQWYWALMDYGSYLGRELKIDSKKYNPNTASRHYTKQSKFQGSDRQIRGKVLEVLLGQKNHSITFLVLYKKLLDLSGDQDRIDGIAQDLIKEGFVDIKKNAIVLKR